MIQAESDINKGLMALTRPASAQAEVREELASTGIAPSAEKPEGRPLQFSGTLHFTDRRPQLCPRSSALAALRLQPRAHSSALRNLRCEASPPALWD